MTENLCGKASGAGVGRRKFLTDSGRAALGMGILKAGGKVLAQKTPSPAIHNMLIVGKKTTFLYHLPQFSFPGFVSPRRYQMILEATFTQSGKSLQDAYAAERAKYPDKQIYTFGPERFAFSKAIDLPTALKGTIFRGHLEKKGSVPIFKDVVANIARVSYFKEFESNASKNPDLDYRIFGRGQELFMAHLLSKPPDFDQILSVNYTDKEFTSPYTGTYNFLDEDVRQGAPTLPLLRIIFPQRNLLTQRLKPKQSIEGTSYRISHTLVKESVKISVGIEYYFEEGELRTPPEYATTPAEREAGFPQ